MARFGEKLVAFGPAFASARLVSMGTKGNEIRGEEGEEGVESAGASRAGTREAAGPSVNGIESAFETEAIKGDIVTKRGFQ